MALVSFLIATTCMNIFQIAIDTMLLCFCEDCKSNDGSKERPYYMTDSLLDFVDSHDRNTIKSLQVSYLSY